MSVASLNLKPRKTARILQNLAAIMCGRFTLHHSPEQVAERFSVQETLFDFPPRYNIAPMQPIAVITRNSHGDDKVVLEGFRWGLVPIWAKDAAIGSKMINARVETLAEKASFKTALKRRRCLIPADGFYEWKAETKAKIPHHIRFRDERIYAFAGLWEEWQAPDGSPLRTATIITGPPNNLLSTLHHRMAVILRPELEKVWLDPKTEAGDALDLLQIYPDEELEAFVVGKNVGNVTYDDERLILPTTEDGQNGNGQLSLL